MAAKAAKAEKVEFTYEGTNRGGGKVKGEIFALSDTLAKNELRRQGINPIKVKKKPRDLFGGAKKPDAADIAIFKSKCGSALHTSKCVSPSAGQPSGDRPLYCPRPKGN